MNNEIPRKKRYREKIDFIVEKIESFPKKDLTSLEKDGIFYGLIVIIEAAFDMTAMILKDVGKKVEDNYTNISSLQEVRKIPENLGEKLKKCNELRNLLVHRYNAIDDEVALDSVEEVKNILYEFIEFVEGFLNEFEENAS